MIVTLQSEDANVRTYTSDDGFTVTIHKEERLHLELVADWPIAGLMSWLEYATALESNNA